MIKKVLTIAGSDSSGGAGIQADIKTITAHKMYAMSVICAVTSQNTTGVYDVLTIDKNLVASQLESVFTDIFPDSIKIGMVSSTDNIETVAKKLKEYNAKNIVLDPVMVSTSKSKLIFDNAIDTLKSILMPLCDVITPNIYEAEVLSGITIKNKSDMIKAAEKINLYFNGKILIKGGHLNKAYATDLLYDNGNIEWFSQKRINNPNTHGTGCTLSSAIACNLANGYDIQKSIKNAKTYLTGAISYMLNLGNGNGPLNHTYNINKIF